MTGYPYGHTAAANPLSCAVGLAALEETLDRDLIGNAATGRRSICRTACFLSADEIPDGR